MRPLAIIVVSVVVATMAGCGQPSTTPNKPCLESSECSADQVCCNDKGKAVCTPKNSCKGVELGPR